MSGCTSLVFNPLTNPRPCCIPTDRSFDHLLGLNPKLNVDGIPAGASQPRDPDDPNQGTVPVTDGGYDVSPDDPQHSFEQTTMQINNQRMDGFVRASISNGEDETNPVSMFTPETAPVINTLAEEFAVFDHWYCSFPGSTDPNRAFAMGGTPDGVDTNFNGTLWGTQSYIDYLNERGVTAGGYYQDDLWALGYYKDFQKPRNSRKIKPLDDFFIDIEEDNLPSFTWLQPRSSTHGSVLPTWQHPDAPVSLGEDLYATVYNAIRNSAGWNSTLFLLTYDEHGGFYDHVPPPNEGIPNPDGKTSPQGFKYDRLGIRVPTIAISPWIPRGVVYNDGYKPEASSEFDSTSIIATANELLNVPDPVPLSDRVSWAKRFTDLIMKNDLTEPRTDCPATLSSAKVEGFKHEDMVTLQKAKPINEHLEAQILMFCNLNYPEQFKEGEICEAAEGYTLNQGLASEWILREQAVWMDKVRWGKEGKEEEVLEA